jgi:hypothetical protein
MAREDDPHSATCQFFINQIDNPQWDIYGGGYAVFGKVVGGMDVVDAIASGATIQKGRMKDVPVKPVVIKHAIRKVLDHVGLTKKKAVGRRAGPRHSADARAFLGKFYKVFPDQLSWHEARVRCQQLGGHLAVVKSEEENRFLTTLVRARGIDVVWLGATDEKLEGRWVWVDGEPMRYSDWSPVGRQPNNKNGLEHYLIMMLAHDGKWSDQPNHSVEASPGFICQWD